jgi:catechol 2,3-dioxygenase-like lactoylglutathione lyase family enzyme
MKRFHVHVAVNELADSVRFYSAIFGAEPTVLREDYAKWMLEDPRINFAISKRGHTAGVNHLGFQVEDDAELHSMRTRLDTADASLIEQTGQACCYAKSDKYWITDPQGIAWETFHTLESIPVYGEDTVAATKSSACCVPLAPTAKAEGASCCVPTEKAGGSACCAA